ncbi:laccase domain-containing protein [Candidatus Microgenomates bacterium]|nr:laccase domain-containing protein [Candidatus Microgenomates bacterium]
MIFVSSKVSDGNMSFFREDKKTVLENRKKFLKRLGINPNSVAEVKQIHSNKIISVTNRLPSSDTKADGLITNETGIYLMVKIADCIPIGLYDPKHNAIGLIHVGWRGLEKDIIKNVVKSMKKNFNTNPKDLIVKFGPSIGPCHYRLNLWQLAEDQLQKLSVLKKNIDNPKICTYESKDYFSHRRSVVENLKEDYRFITTLGINLRNS